MKLLQPGDSQIEATPALICVGVDSFPFAIFTVQLVLSYWHLIMKEYLKVVCDWWCNSYCRTYPVWTQYSRYCLDNHGSPTLFSV